MFPLKQIVFPVDFSPRCAGAARYVEALAGRFEAKVKLIHVVDSSGYFPATIEYGGSSWLDFQAQRVELSKRMLDSWLVPEFRYVEAERIVVEGDPASSIVSCAHSEPGSMIVIPTHGLGPFRRFLIGSVTAKVLHDAHCPVWTGVHLEDSPPLDEISFRRIVCGVDLGPHTETLLRFASALREEYDAELTLVHAAPVSKHVEEMRKPLQDWAKALGFPAGTCLGHGDPAEVLRQAVLGHNAQLVIIGRGQITEEGLGRLRTHSYSIIRQSPCPVISV
jgi:nucleotide-binding universal stress UspA family protein